ncbi:hypothetical protein [Nocardia sp. NPDC050718]|uniref:hypothetical protein n=1 Tax=Nocardia sp. NPDC050718 TaxID=3155788 RepID=UPI0033E3B6C3
MFSRRRRKSKRRNRSDDTIEDGGVVGEVLIEGATTVARLIGRVVSGILNALT